MSTQTEGDPAACGCGNKCDSKERGPVTRRVCRVTETLREHSGLTALVALGGGLVIGYLVGHSVARRSSGADRGAAERLGQRIMERLDRVLPDRITKRFRG